MVLHFGFGLGGPSPSLSPCSFQSPLMEPVGQVVAGSYGLSQCLPCHLAHHYGEGLWTCPPAAVVVYAVVVAVAVDVDVAAVAVAVVAVAAGTTAETADSFPVDLADTVENCTHLGSWMVRGARADLAAGSPSQWGREERRGLEEG